MFKTSTFVKVLSLVALLSLVSTRRVQELYLAGDEGQDAGFLVGETLMSLQDTSKKEEHGRY